MGREIDFAVKRILFVATVVKTHIMQFHLPYLKMLKEMGWQTAVAARNDYEDPADCVIPHCDRYFDVCFERKPIDLRNLKAYGDLKRIIDEGEYDVIHCHTPVGAMLTRLAARDARRHGTKVFYTAHGFHFYRGAPAVNWLMYYPAERLLAHDTDVLITINKEDYQLAQGFRAGKVCYVPGVGIDLEKFPGADAARRDCRSRITEEFGIPRDAVILLSVGEVNRNKNHQAVIKALERLQNRDIYYVICGRGPLRAAHEALAAQLGVKAQVILTGYRNDAADLYRSADVFVFPSLREGLPVAVMEAMASGLPVICSPIRGNTDLIENGIDGLLVEAEPEKLAAAIERLCADAQLRHRLGMAAQEKSRRFDLNSVKEELRRLYEEATA